MSVDHTVPELVRTKQHKKSKDTSERRSQKKKRKRDALEDQDAATPSTSPQKQLSSKRKKGLRPSSKPTKNSTPSNDSPFYQQTSSLYLPLSPICQHNPLQGICAEHLSPLILTYYPLFHGVVLSYSNVRLSETSELEAHQGEGVLAKSVDEYAASFVWVTADFTIFKPRRGGWIEGWVNLQNEGHVGLVCWNLFNASIEKKRLPPSWKWIAAAASTGSRSTLKEGTDDMVIDGFEEEEPAVEVPSPDSEEEGHFEDAEGNIIEGAVRFRVIDVETSPSTEKEKGFLSIQGTILDEEQEKALSDQEHTREPRGNPGEFAGQSLEGTVVGTMVNRMVNRVNTSGHIAGNSP